MNDLHFAISIGIDRYPGLPGRDLGSARRDASAFHVWATDPEGGAVPAQNARLIAVDDAIAFDPASAGRPAIVEINLALKDVNARLKAHPTAASHDWPRTRLYLYVAGHGVGPGLGEAALLMADADPDTLNNCMELTRYADWYLRCGLVHEVIVFADCCRELTDGASDPYGPPFTTCRLGPSGTVVLLGYASRLGEKSWEPASTGERDRARGYFTRALLEGLRGSAPPDPVTGAIDAAGLAQYVQGVVEERTKGIESIPYPQRGEWPADLATARSIVFRRPAGVTVTRPRRVVAIHPPAGHDGPLLVEDEEFAVHARWQPGDAVPWTALLAEGIYQVRHDPRDRAAPPLAGDGFFRLHGADADVRL